MEIKSKEQSPCYIWTTQKDVTIASLLSLS